MTTRIDSDCLPSNQRNPTGDYPATPQYEKDIWHGAAQHFADEMQIQGHTCRVIDIESPDAVTTDELLVMVKTAKADLLGKSGYRLAASLHSNTGSGTNYMAVVVLDSRHDAFAGKVQKLAAARCGLPLGKVYHESIYFTSILDPLGPGHVILFETGEHQTAKDAAWLGKYAPFYARMEARALIEAITGSVPHDGPVPGTVVVPAGAQFDKYRPGTLLPPDPAPPAVSLPTIKLTSPLMRDAKTGDFAATYNITEYPIHWVQWTEKHHVYKVDPGYYTYTDDKGATHREPISSFVPDGIWGWKSRGLHLKFEGEHYALDGSHLVVDGDVTAPDWGKLRTV